MKEEHSSHRKKESNKTARRAVIAAAILLLLIAGAVVLLKIRPAWGFIVKDYFLRRSEKASYEIVPAESVESVQVSEEEMLSLVFADHVQVVFNRSMLLINAEHLLEEDYSIFNLGGAGVPDTAGDSSTTGDTAGAGGDLPPDVDIYKDTDVLMNACIMDSYASLAAAVRERTGEPLYVRSAYRSAEEQASESAENAEKAQAVGASEHQAGLALDVYVPYFAGSGFIKHKAGQFVNAECWRYGFIIRYPYFGKAETGIAYEPWHIRYVGAPHAEIMYRNSLTLEKYMEILPENGYLKYGDYLVTRRSSRQDVAQGGAVFTIPAHFESAVISPDNCGGWVMTFRI